MRIYISFYQGLEKAASEWKVGDTSEMHLQAQGLRQSLVVIIFGCRSVIAHATGFLAPYEDNDITSKDEEERERKHDENDDDEENDVENGEVEYVTNISPGDEWLAFRNNMAANMFNTWANR
ncbi:hypothetical protein Tco_0583181 [Tanacetum coccineum]